MFSRAPQQRMIADHTQANAQIAAIAKNLNMKYPQSHIQTSNPTPEQPNAQGTLPPAATHANPATALPASQYMQQEVQNHQKAIALFQSEAKNGGSSELRALAGQMLAQLQAHLAMAQQYTNTGRITPVSTPTPGQAQPPR